MALFLSIYTLFSPIHLANTLQYRKLKTASITVENLKTHFSLGDALNKKIQGANVSQVVITITTIFLF